MLDPHSVDQVLRVLELFRQNKKLGFATPGACSRAIHEVAAESSVYYQTIGDGCRRRLGLTDMGEFHRLAEDWIRGDADSLVRVMKQNSSKLAHGRIDSFFYTKPNVAERGTLAAAPVGRDTSSKPVRITIENADARMLRVLAQLEDREPEALALELLNDAARGRLRAALA